MVRRETYFRGLGTLWEFLEHDFDVDERVASPVVEAYGGGDILCWEARDLVEVLSIEADH